MKPRELITLTLLSTAAFHRKSAENLAWLARCARPVIDDRTGARVYQYGAEMKTIGWSAVFGFPLFILLTGVLPHPPKDEEVTIVVLMLAFGPVLGVPLLWESLRYRLMVSNDGLDCRSPWRGHRFVPWSEVDRLSYSKALGWFVVHATDGWRFRIPILVNGVPILLSEFQRYMPDSALQDARPGFQALKTPLPGFRWSPPPT